MKTINKELFIKNIDIMINNSSKGASGFWYDTEDCCGNPEVFIAIKKGLKEHKSVNLEHDICPWNRDVMYGNKYGSIQSGCFHSCGLRDAKYLSPKLLKDILLRFKKRYLNGEYEIHKNHDCKVELRPLLTEGESNYIKKQQELEPIIERKKKQKAAEKAIKMNPDDESWINMLGAYYGTNIVLQAEENDSGMDFSREFAKGIVGAENITYDECLDLQWKTRDKKKHSAFQALYYNIPLGFKGQIERKSNGHICFKRIYIDAMYGDGVCYFDKEDHVWMDEKGFEKYNVDDYVEFFAEVYRYIKKSDGKIIDFGLRNPSGVTKIEKYKLPSDKALANQAINEIICETCYLREQCNGVICMRNPKEKRSLKKSMLDVVLK